MAEAYMNMAGAGRWRAYSAGSKPTGEPNPFAIETLKRHEIPRVWNGDGPRSKTWDEFAAPNAPVMDVIVTVCDNAAGETCPLWPANKDAEHRKLHWSFPDPAAAQGDEADMRSAFEDVFTAIRARIDDFLAEDQA